MAPRRDRRSRRNRSACVAALAFLSLHCGPVQRDSRTAVSIDGYRAEPVQKSYGCDNVLDHKWEHAHTGASIAVEHEGRSGLIGGARARVVDSRVTANRRASPSERPAPPTAEQEQSLLTSIGGHIGYEWRHVGVAAGLTMAMLDVGQPIPWPFVRIAVGEMDTAWVEFDIGDMDPLYRGRLVSLGAGGRFEALTARFGLGIYGHIVPDLGSEDARWLTLTRGDIGPNMDLTWHPVDSVGLTLSATLGLDPAGRVGLVWTFGGD